MVSVNLTVDTLQITVCNFVVEDPFRSADVQLNECHHTFGISSKRGIAIQTFRIFSVEDRSRHILQAVLGSLVLGLALTRMP